MAKPRKQLTYKQKAFVNEFIANGFNGTKAALEVYDIQSENKNNVAKSMGSEVLAVPAVASAIDCRIVQLEGAVHAGLCKAIALAQQRLEGNDEQLQSWAATYFKDLAKIIAQTQERVAEHKHVHFQAPKRN